MRVYVPTTLADLAGRVPLDPATGDVADARVVVADGGALAFAVTPALREWYREGDLEELEYAALTRAARASLRLLGAAAGFGAPFRRVVLVAEVPDGGARPASDIDVAAVRTVDVVRFSDLAAVHVDDVLADDDVAAAAAVVEAADAGDDDARFVVEGLDDHELAWYATQEVAFLLG